MVFSSVQYKKEKIVVNREILQLNNYRIKLVEDLTELENSPEKQSIESEPSEESTETQEGDVSLDNLKDEEIASEEQKDSDTSNS